MRPRVILLLLGLLIAAIPGGQALAHGEGSHLKRFPIAWRPENESR